jgi:F5/8 type C domain
LCARNNLRPLFKPSIIGCPIPARLVRTVGSCWLSFNRSEDIVCSRPLQSKLPCLDFLFVLLLIAASGAFAQTIRVDTSHPVNSLIPNQSLGAGIDRLPSAAVGRLFTPAAVNKILTSGWQPVTYRQNTELFVEAWHWNPNGVWSDPSGKGYFTGNAIPAEMIQHSYGYPLPHRGFTRNEGTGTTGYSRLTDGDLNTYWKSNPYLAKAFTGEDDSLHPQWVVVDLATTQPINAIRIAWADPYARHYLVQYWTGDDPMKQPTRGAWVTFPGGLINNGQGGAVALQLRLCWFVFCASG